MRTILFLAACLFCIQAFSQTAVDKAAGKVAGTLYQAEKAKATVDKIKGWLPKKKAKPVDTVAVKPVSANTTVISIAGIDFADLKTLNDNVKACQGVTASTMKFAAGTSTIEVLHTGTTEDLFALLSAVNKDVFAEKNIEGLEAGKIAIKMQ